MDSDNKAVPIQKLHRCSRQHTSDVTNLRPAEVNILLSQRQSMAEEVKHDLPLTVNKGLMTPYRGLTSTATVVSMCGKPFIQQQPACRNPPAA